MREIEGTLPYERVPVHKSFASHALHRKRGALHVVNAELGASVLTEIKLSDQGASYHVRRHVSKVPTGDSCTAANRAVIRLSRPRGRAAPAVG